MPSAKEPRLTWGPGPVRYAHGRLIVCHAGDYKVTVSTPNGRTVAVFKGSGLLSFPLAREGLAKGVYIAVLSSAQGPIIQRFLVH
jgi:hypothetical protein